MKPKRAAAALHSKASAEWFTPQPFVEAARATMGYIDLDPASCKQANETIKARTFYDEHDDGLDQEWEGRVFLNPPGGLVRPFWEMLVSEWRSGRVEQAIWVGYSLDQLQVLQSSPSSPLDFPLCFPNRRIAFIAPSGGKNSPTHGNYIAYLPSRQPEPMMRFETEFAKFGKVRR